MKRMWGILLALLVSACSGSIGPDAGELEKKFALGLPSIWKLTSFKVTAEENTGTKTQPDVRTRFVATVEIARDLYSPQARLGDTAVLTQTHKVGDKKVELHGVARSRQNAGQWATEFDLENTAAVNISDKPLSDYPKYVIAGSAEEKALLAKAQKAEQEARQAAEEQERKERAEAEVLAKRLASAIRPGATIRGRITANSSGNIYPIEFSFNTVDTQAGTFTARLSWPSYGAINAGNGVYAGPRFQFRETETLKRADGAGAPNCIFDLRLEGEKLIGTVRNCGDGKTELALR